MNCEIKRLIKSSGAVKNCPFAPDCTFRKDIYPHGGGAMATFGKCLDEETTPKDKAENSCLKQVKS